MIFMNALFGYLVFLIFFKWFKDWNAPSCTSDPMCAPPDLKAILIGMFMSPGNVPPKLHLYEGQAVVQVSFGWAMKARIGTVPARHST